MSSIPVLPSGKVTVGSAKTVNCALVAGGPTGVEIELPAPPPQETAHQSGSAASMLTASVAQRLLRTRQSTSASTGGNVNGRVPNGAGPRRDCAVVVMVTVTGTVCPAVVRLRHLSIQEQVKLLNQMLRGHYAYYGVAGNLRALLRVHRAVEHYWRKMLSSRSWHGTVRWEQFQRIKEQFRLLRPKLHYSYKELQAIAIP
jgi:hypothetical protein